MPRDFEVTRKYKPEPASKRQKSCMKNIDPTDYEIYAKKLELICREGRDMLMKMGISSMIQSGDLAVGLYTAEGDLATGWLGIHLHLVNGQLAIKYILKHFMDDSTVGVKPGDMYYVNEVLAGGIHNADQLLVMPIFHDGELIGWSSASGHETETGSIEPGGQSPSATSRYTDGMSLLPFKIGEDYRLKKDLIELLENMVREARMQTLDIKARAAACQLMERRVNEIIDNKGVNFIIGIFRKMIEETTVGARKKIARLNDGIYRQPVFFDNMGLNKDGLARTMVHVIKKGDRITIDFSDTSLRIEEGNFNSRPHGMIGHVAIYLFQFLFWDLKPNVGAFVPFDFIFPEGSFFDADPEDATSKGIETCIMSLNAVHVAMEKMYFDNDNNDQSIAPWSMINTPVFAGLNQYYQMIVCYDQGIVNGSGMGARRNMDGIDVTGFNFTYTAEYPDVEHFEIQYPVLCLFRNRYMADGHGFGRFRGGRTVEACYIIHNVFQVFSLTIGAAGSKFPRSAALFGGYQSPPIPCVRLKDHNIKDIFIDDQKNIPYSSWELLTNPEIKGEFSFETLNSPMDITDEGDILYIHSHGGGGYGDVLERDPALVVKDVKDGTTSEWTARNIYRVAYDQQTFEIDEAKTRKLREKERKDRIKRAKPYDEFENEWKQKSPDEDLLEYFGIWPGTGLGSDEKSIKM